MSVRVVVPGQLRGYTRGRPEVQAEGATVDAVLWDLDRQFPGFRFRVIDEQDRVRRHILLFVGEERREDLHSPVPDGAALQLVGALSGG
ncbi:MAG: MoaD/ThiS family protein [Deltaproteobacteria bacterium]|nr:MoaD/ThiS family protein [Deltaproteobacteria bacterium]